MAIRARAQVSVPLLPVVRSTKSRPARSTFAWFADGRTTEFSLAITTTEVEQMRRA